MAKPLISSEAGEEFEEGVAVNAPPQKRSKCRIL